MARTVIEVFEETSRRHARRPAFARRLADGTWETTDWSTYRRRVVETAHGLLTLGLEPGEGVVIMAANRPEWFVADLAAIACGALPAGVYRTSTPEQIVYVAEHCRARIAVVEADHLPVLRAARPELDSLETTVVVGSADLTEGEIAWDEVGRRCREDEASLEERIRGLEAEDPCTLIYTSGTTGPPKAVMLTHHNVTWEAQTAVDLLGIEAGDDFISYLPLSHVAEQMVSLYLPMAGGGCSWFVPSVEDLPDRLREVRPSFFLGVPRVWEKIQAAIEAAGSTASALRRRIVAWARKTGLEATLARQDGRRDPLLLPVAERLVFSKVRKRLGLDRCRMAFSGSAPLARSTAEFFASLGIVILDIYGLSENTGAATLSLPESFRLGTSGPPLPGTEIRIADDGEILIRGPHVFPGYYRDEEATRAALDDDGWLHSGDIGRFTDEGFLQVTDRKKDLLITSGGKNVAPQLIEAKLKAARGIGQAVVVGDGRKFLAALVVPDPEALSAIAEQVGSTATSLEEAAVCPRIRAYLQDRVDEVNSTLARYETIKRFAILPTELAVETGELTPTMKVKRSVVAERWDLEIEGLYEGV